MRIKLFVFSLLLMLIFLLGFFFLYKSDPSKVDDYQGYEQEIKAQAKVVLYVKVTCPFCQMAKGLLDNKKVQYKVIEVDRPEVAQKMKTLSGGNKTVPQIFVDDEPIGGFDSLYELDQQDQLDDLLWPRQKIIRSQ